MAPFRSARRCLVCVLIVGCSSGDPAHRPDPEPEPEPATDAAAMVPPRTTPADSAAPMVPAADGGASPTGEGDGPAPRSDASVPPLSTGSDGLAQLLVSSAIGLGYYTACHIMPDLSVRCFGD